MLLLRHPYALLASTAAGISIVIFEIVEVLVIGLPPGYARNLQVFYFSLGLIIFLVAGILWSSERRTSPVR